MTKTIPDGSCFLNYPAVVLKKYHIISGLLFFKMESDDVRFKIDFQGEVLNPSE